MQGKVRGAETSAQEAETRVQRAKREEKSLRDQRLSADWVVIAGQECDLPSLALVECAVQEKNIFSMSQSFPDW